MLAQAQDDAEQAAALYRESLECAQHIGEKVTIARCLEGMAGAAGRHEVPVQAARLLGVTAALRATMGFPVAAIDHVVYGRTLAAVRGTLSDADFDAAWAAGCSMPLEQTIAEACALPGGL